MKKIRTTKLTATVAIGAGFLGGLVAGVIGGWLARGESDKLLTEKYSGQEYLSRDDVEEELFTNRATIPHERLPVL